MDEQLPYEVHTPGPFFILVDDSQPALVEMVAAEQQAYWELKKEPKTLDQAVRDAGCPRFADRVGVHLEHLSRTWS